eukprot:812125-Prymnesium_polylepis.1
MSSHDRLGGGRGGTWRWVKPLIWADNLPIGDLHWTAAVQGLSSLWVEFAVSPDVHRKRPYLLAKLLGIQ